MTKEQNRLEKLRDEHDMPGASEEEIGRYILKNNHCQIRGFHQDWWSRIQARYKEFY